MDNKILCRELNSLIQLDIDAVQAYAMALRSIDLHVVAADLRRFQADHERHIVDLTPVVLRYGGEPPKMTPDFKGFLIKGFTAIRSVTGIEGALGAMRQNELLTNSTYQKALAFELPADAAAVVQRNFEDEQRHLQYIEKALRDRPWEAASAAHV